MSVIAFTNQKGGVGKTTSAINVAAELALAGHPTLLIDADPQGNASSGVGAKDRTRGTYELLMSDTPLRELTQSTSVNNLDVLAANEHLAGAEVELSQAEGRYVRLARKLNNTHYRYIIIDCPPSLGFLSINGMVAARHVIIPVQCEYYALEGLSRLSDTLKKVKRSLNPDLELLGVLLTMYDRRLKLAQQVEADVRRHFPDRTFQAVIPRSVRLAEAPSFGKPVSVFARLSRGGNAYKTVAEEVHVRAEQRAWQRA
ncbi:ParA family protein [Patescibacteria group bacterium]|nr:ParA family protein [Patescibacteria group bacterium]